MQHVLATWAETVTLYELLDRQIAKSVKITPRFQAPFHNFLTSFGMCLLSTSLNKMVAAVGIGPTPLSYQQRAP